MDNIVVRTDLAVEANEEAMNGTGKLRGIRLRESKKSRMGVKVTELQVTNHLGEAAIGRPKGTYLTIEADHNSRTKCAYSCLLSITYINTNVIYNLRA